jgi:hypothetical protein
MENAMKNALVLAIILLSVLTFVQSSSASQSGSVAVDFGSPPAGEVPILFNDQHVYVNPDTLRSGRVLGALVMNGQIMVPLRSMFEQMGATVSYDPASQTATASKPGAQVQVTLGKAEVLINGESRPLDVPPVMYKGALLVPVRVISEALGAYVEWVPDQRVVVVRYLPPTPVPTPPPTPAPTMPPTPAPTPTPAPAWQVALTPYLWVPSLRGTINYDIARLPNGEPGMLTFGVAPGDYLNKLNSAAMFAIDAHSRSLDLFSDFMWMNFSNTNTVSATVTGPFGKVQLPVSLQAGARFVANIWTVGAGVPVVDNESVLAELFVGERFTQPKSSIDWTLTTPSEFLDRSGSASFMTTLYDFIGGTKGDFYLSSDKKWFVPFYIDVGSGTFGSTWQYVGGLGYGRNASVTLGYRGLSYTSSQGHLPNLRMNGPILGYTFRF